MVGPSNQRRADNAVAGRIDDGNVGMSLMRDPDPDIEIDDLTGGVALYVGGVVCKLVASAEPEVAVLGVVRLLQTAWVGSEESFGVRGVVGSVEVGHNLAACCLGGFSRPTCCRLSDKAVCRSLGDEPSEAEQRQRAKIHGDGIGRGACSIKGTRIF